MQRIGWKQALSVAVLALVLAGTAHAAACRGVLSLPASHDPALIAILSTQAGHNVTTTGVMRQATWSIYRIAGDGEPGYMFFDGPPRPNPKAFVWGGVAQPDEYRDVLANVRKNAPGIPVALATCFARRVTGHP